MQIDDPACIKILSVLNDLSLATVPQVAAVAGYSRKDTRRCFEILLKARVIRDFGYPSVPKTNPLKGLYFGCTRSALGEELIGERFTPTRKEYTPVPVTPDNTHGLNFYRLKRGESLCNMQCSKKKTCPKGPENLDLREGPLCRNCLYSFPLHSAKINYAAAWLMNSSRNLLTADPEFFGEQNIRKVLHWYYGRIPTLKDRMKGEPHSIPDFILQVDVFYILCEVELHAKSSKRYEEYFDHVKPDFRVLYLVENQDTGNRIMKRIPEKFFEQYHIDFVLINDNLWLKSSFNNLLPAPYSKYSPNETPRFR